jgi:tetratricopeptide (TPR) repeat protein
MKWPFGIFGARRRREKREAIEERVERELASGDHVAAWRTLSSAIEDDPEPIELFHLAARVLRAGRENETAELFDRAADAPHDAQRLFELGSQLLSSDQAGAAASILSRAIDLVPFDAVVRSELALAHARAGRPDRVVETLALHPCLAEDPGALFQFAWASLLSGDIASAQGALAELEGVPLLRKKLEGAVLRAQLELDRDPPAARDFYFIEHGGILIDDGGPLAGRYAELHLDRERVSHIVSSAGAIASELFGRDVRVVAIDEAHRALADAFASACGGEVIKKGAGRLPAAIIPVFSGDLIASIDRESRDAEGTVIFALSLDFTRSAARAPDLVGAFVRNATRAQELFPIEERAIDPGLRSFVTSRRAFLPPDARSAYAYVPDEPLPK